MRHHGNNRISVSDLASTLNVVLKEKPNSTQISINKFSFYVLVAFRVYSYPEMNSTKTSIQEHYDFCTKRYIKVTVLLLTNLRPFLDTLTTAMHLVFKFGLVLLVQIHWEVRIRQKI